MKLKLLAAAALLATIPGTLAAQQQQPPEAAELIALDNAWINAQVQHNQAALQEILDPNFITTFLNGNTVTRDGYIQFIMGREITPYQVQHLVLRLHGDTAVVVDGTANGALKILWVAVKRNGKWAIVSQSFAQMPRPAAAPAQPAQPKK